MTVDNVESTNADRIEVIDVIDSWHLDFYEGSIIKHIARSKRNHKNQLQDLETALWYLTRLVNNLSANKPF